VSFLDSSQAQKEDVNYRVPSEREHFLWLVPKLCQERTARRIPIVYRLFFKENRRGCLLPLQVVRSCEKIPQTGENNRFFMDRAPVK
jgi:hypothetical protein